MYKKYPRDYFCNLIYLASNFLLCSDLDRETRNNDISLTFYLFIFFSFLFSHLFGSFDIITPFTHLA